MTDWKLHLISSLLLAMFLLSVFFYAKFQITPTIIAALIILTIFTSLFPDVDMKKSKIRSLLSLIAAFAISFAYVFLRQGTWHYAPVYFLILYFVFKHLPTKHRGLLHSFKFSVIFSLTLAYLCYLLAGLNVPETLFWFCIILFSYNLHLLLDKL